MVSPAAPAVDGVAAAVLLTTGSTDVEVLAHDLSKTTQAHEWPVSGWAERDSAADRATAYLATRDAARGCRDAP